MMKFLQRLYFSVLSSEATKRGKGEKKVSLKEQSQSLTVQQKNSRQPETREPLPRGRIRSYSRNISQSVSSTGFAGWDFECPG
jgi:hypothetical protein